MTGGFTTLLVLLMLLYAAADQVPSRVEERIPETLLGVGVGVALVFGAAIPARRGRASTTGA